MTVPFGTEAGRPHARRRRDRLGQDGHADADGRARDRARHAARSSSTRRATTGCASSCVARPRDAGREFLEWTPDGPCVYNPYARGGDTEIADRVLAGERFTEPHYLRQAQRYLGHAVRALRAAGAEVSLSAIVEQLEPRRARAAARAALPEPTPLRGQAYLDSLTPRQLRDLAASATVWRSSPSPTSGVARPCGRRRAAVRPARRGPVRERSSTSASKPTAGRCSRRCSARRSCRTCRARSPRCRATAPTLVVIDEFSAIAAEQVVALFGRARSAGFSLCSGTQELSRSAAPGTRAAARAGDGQSLGADRAPPGRARLGRAASPASPARVARGGRRGSSDGRAPRGHACTRAARLRSPELLSDARARVGGRSSRSGPSRCASVVDPSGLRSDRRSR